MIKLVIIDGNNLIHKVARLKKMFAKNKETTQRALIESVRTNFNKLQKTLFVFDGFGTFKSADVIFSGSISADEIIKNKLEDYQSYNDIKVVSSDYGILNFAKMCGCDIQKSEDFWNEAEKIKSVTHGKNINQNFIYDKAEKPERMSKREIEEFKKYFS